VLDESSDDDDDLLVFTGAQFVQNFSNVKKKHGGSVIGREYIYRDKQGGHERMYQDYLAENPTYGSSFFRRRLILFSHWIHSFLCIFVTIMFRILFNFFQV
jgi:hypothetical protein